jgi:hypothetical protein
MKSAAEIGMKITAAQREYFRYTGVSSEMERRGLGVSRPGLAWTRRVRQQEAERVDAAPNKDDARRKPI